MIRQDDILLNNMSDLPFEEYGCALFDVQYLSVMYGENTFKREHFISECENWLRSKVIDKETTILKWDRLLQDSGLPYKLVFEDGTHKLHSMRELQSGELQLLYLYNPQTGFHHFVVGDEGDHIMYDSLGESETAKAYRKGKAYVESRRVFRRIK